jgi:hypothetical protein
VHASWLNQIEIYFSIVQRKVLSPNDFTNLPEVEQRLLAFQHRYQQTAVPFDWRYSRTDLNALLRRLAKRTASRLPHNQPPRTSRTDHLACVLTCRLVWDDQFAVLPDGRMAGSWAAAGAFGPPWAWPAGFRRSGDHR